MGSKKYRVNDTIHNTIWRVVMEELECPPPMLLAYTTLEDLGFCAPLLGFENAHLAALLQRISEELHLPDDSDAFKGVRRDATISDLERMVRQSLNATPADSIRGPDHGVREGARQHHIQPPARDGFSGRQAFARLTPNLI